MAKKTKEDPSGQRDNRQKARNEVVKRLDHVEDKILRLVDRIPTRMVANFYDYSAAPPQYFEQLRADVASSIEEELETEQDEMLFVWWFNPKIELSFRQGSIEQLVDVNRVLSELHRTGDRLLSTVPIDSYLNTRAYRDSLRIQQSNTFHSIKSLGETLAAQVMKQIISGVESGLSTAEITTTVMDRFDVSKSRAKLIVDTEINSAYNNARMRVIQSVNDELGLNLKVQHISALLPTTRAHHAARHMGVYTVKQQLQWWNQGANRVNCHCSIRGVVDERAATGDSD